MTPVHAAPARPAAPHAELHRRLHAIVGDAGLVHDAHAQAPYLRDWQGRRHGRAALVVRPADTAQTSAVMRVCHETHTPVVTQGGNTGLRGGATPDASGAQIVLHTGRLDRIRCVDPVNMTLVAEAGVALARVQQAAQDAGRAFALRLGSEAHCTIGGNLATNAGGATGMRALTLGLEVVLPDGQVWNGLQRRHQDHGGIDLRQLLIGSEGALGVITAAMLRLQPRPAAVATAWVGAAQLDALVALQDALRTRCGEGPAAFELMSGEAVALVLTQVPGTRAPLAGRHAFQALIACSGTCAGPLAGPLQSVLAEASAAGALGEVAFGSTPVLVQDFWRLRQGIAEAQLRAGRTHKHDVWLPLSRLSAFVAQAGAALRRQAPDVRLLCFGHLGDGSLTCGLLVREAASAAVDDAALQALGETLHALAAEHGGSAVAAQGADAPRRHAHAIEADLLMRIKQALDPNHLMNPGKVF
nr:FAD-binding oxidoreductase [Variovorax boronicumulans]